MMKKEKSSPWMRSKVLYAIPMVALALSAFATPAIVNPIDGIVVNDEDKVKETSSNLQRNVVANEKFVTNDSIYDVVQKFAEFPGGQKAFNEWMSENFQYPDSCMKEGIQGRVVLQFVVNTDGSIADVKPVRSPHPALTEAAIQIVKKMPRWIPAEHEGKKVRCRFNLPFMFRLSFDKAKNKTEENSEGLRVSRYKLHELPADILIVMDDKPYEGSPKDLVMEDIESFAVLQKSPALTAQYGARAANGAILITTKAAKKGQVGK